MENRFDSTLGNGGNMGTMTEAPAPSSPPAPSVVEQAQQQAGKMADQARQQVKSQLESQKDRAAEGLGGIAAALHQAGQHLRENGQGPIGDYADSAARQVEQVTRYLSGQSIDQFVYDAEQFARRRPGLFLGGAFTLGFLAARFLKSSGANDGYTTGASYAPGGYRAAYSPPYNPAPASPPAED